ncbi:MAG TPA: hypothetical protein VMF61_05155 [Candidatus Acidoferrales bacterium]|nr:hypothetical protein [Candidatus Acidoferrales bacterium]
MVRRPLFALTIALGTALTACTPGVGGGIPLASSEDGVQTVGDAAAVAAHQATGTQNAALAIAVADAIGSRIKDVTDANAATAGAPRLPATGTCVDGREFFAPDRRADAQSTESAEFYDAGCRSIARDTVRVYAPKGSNGETVTTTTALFRRNAASSFAQRTVIAQYDGARFAPLGFPSAGSGFHEVSRSVLSVAGRRVTQTGSQIVMLPNVNAIDVYCETAAGYSVAGFPSLDSTFGWQGGTLSDKAAIRIDDGSGRITWSSTQSGQVDQASIGGLTMNAGAPTRQCPIDEPAFGIAGGKVKLTYTIPMQAEFDGTQLNAVTVTEANVGDGYTLNVMTTGEGPTASVRGRITSGSTEVASIATDVFGNGLLQITSTGAEYPIVDWTVVR